MKGGGAGGLAAVSVVFWDVVGAAVAAVELVITGVIAGIEGEDWDECSELPSS